MVDMAAVAAVFTDIPDGVLPAGTADLQITYLRQASGHYLDAVAEVVKRGRQLCTIQVTILNPEGVQCCAGECCTHFGLPRPNRLFRAGCP